MFLNQPITDEDAKTPEGRSWQVIHKQFNQNSFPRSLIIDGRTWTRISDNGRMNFTGGHRDGGFSHYGEVSLNRQNTEIVEITEDSIIDTSSDTPPNDVAPVPGEPDGEKTGPQTPPPIDPKVVKAAKAKATRAKNKAAKANLPVKTENVPSD